MTEQDVWIGLLKRGKVVPTAFWNRIESGTTVAGVPDIHTIKNARPVWLELKIIRSNRMKMRPAQPGWHIKYAKCGGRSWLVAYIESKELTALLFYRGTKIEELLQCGVAYTTSPPKRNKVELSQDVVRLADYIIRLPSDMSTLDEILFGEKQ